MKYKIFLWSPMLSNVGTNSAMIGIANSITKYSKSSIFFLDILGEFSDKNINKDNHLKFSKINHIVPNTGTFSKFVIFLFSIISIPFLIKQIKSKKPDIIISGLVGFIPSLMKFFFPNLKVINSIQGYPKFSFFRKLIWKIFYSKSDYIITMTNKTKKEILNNVKISPENILVIQNPVISKYIKIKSKENIKKSDLEIFNKDVYCSIGRLTQQKNFLELLRYIKELNSKYKDFNLIILGEGEQKEKLKNYIKKNKLDNCFLLGFRDNPFNYLAKSKLYISSSLWEEPGHTLLEAGYLNIPILTSNCPNGPDEIIQNNKNGIKYDLGNKKDFLEKIEFFRNLSSKERKNLCINMKKVVLDYTEFRFSKKILRIL